MKKHFALLVALIIVFTSVIPTLSACKTKTVESIEVIAPVTEYLVGDTIDYDSLTIKVVYSDNSSQQKTVKELKATIIATADLTKEGETHYTVEYKGKSYTVNIRVVEKKTPSLKEVKSLSILDIKEQYVVNEEIDYNNIKLKVDYKDNTTVTDTVRSLGATVKTYADMTKAGETFYEIMLGGVVARADITVVNGTPTSSSIIAIAWPQFYENYLDVTKKEDVEGEDDFRITDAPYEVGNVNKFIYRPNGTIISSDGGRKPIELQTEAEISIKDTLKAEYQVLGESQAASIVEVDRNTYKFSQDAAGKYIRLKISIDDTLYDLSALEDEADKYRVVEFFVVDGGYNVYDQLGLTVMADLEKIAYSEIWKCDVYLPDTQYQNEQGEQVTVGQNEIKLMPREDSLKLDADEKYLCEYVDNISTVILHNGIVLDADLMPSQFFWTEFDKNEWTLTGDRYQETINSLTQFPEVQKEVVGSLRDGYNNVSDNDGSDRARSYMRVIDTQYVDVAGNSVPGGYAIELNIGLNMQKGIFATKKTDVSGNYNSITAPERGQRSAKYNRVLESYADYEPAMTADPVSHWSLFQMLQARIDGTEMQKFEIKNIALKGNNSYYNDSSENHFHQAGLMLCDNYAKDIAFTNVNADSFYTNIAGDNYGDYSYRDEDGTERFYLGEGAETDNATLSLIGTKFYDAYSNMIFLWRSHAIIENSELKRSGGPLFIMSDAEHTMAEVPDKNFTDEGGPSIRVDKKSKLESFATGNESWYKIFGAQSIVSSLGSIMTPPLSSAGKTFYKQNEQKVNAINIIAVMICAPNLILDGGNPDSADKLLDVRGGFTQVDDEGNVINDFKMHNKTLVDFRTKVLAIKQNATSFAPIVQSGDQFAFVTPPELSDGATGDEYVLSDLDLLGALTGGKMFKKFDEQKTSTWQQGSTDKLCLYLSVGPITKAAWAPYVGVITDLYDLK